MLNDAELSQILNVRKSSIKKFRKGIASYLTQKKIRERAKEKGIDLKMDLIEEKINNEPNNDKLYEMANLLKVRPSSLKKYCEGKLSYMAKKKIETNAEKINIDLSELSNIIDFSVIKDNIGIKNFKFGDYEFSVWEFGETNKSRISICKYNVDTNHIKSRNNTIKELENIISSIYGISNNNGEGIDYNNNQIEVYFNINDSYQNVFNKVKNYLVSNVNRESEKKH